MTRTLVLIVLMVLTAEESTGQPVAKVAPSLILFGNTEGAENIAHILNAGSETLRIDSLGFGTRVGTGWGIDVIDRDSTYRLSFGFGRLVEQVAFPQILVEPGDSVVVFFRWWSCLICKSNLKYSTMVRDSLLVFSSDPVNSRIAVPIDFTYYVGTKEDAPSGEPLALHVYPVPSSSSVTIEVEPSRTGEHVVMISDILGRVYYSQTWPGTQGIPVSIRLLEHINNLRPGVYFVSVHTTTQRAQRAFVITG